ncbi:MAG: hypothetical protein M1840_008068 [Geoglossum simile]|nr:MAG: hypothetical protein M1840_008068 [Geoglossum simile]
MRLTGLSFGLLAVLAHVGVHAAPVEDRPSSPNVIRAAEANSNRDLAAIVNIINDNDNDRKNKGDDRDKGKDRDRDRNRDDDEIIIKIRNRQRKNQQRDKKKDDKRIDAYRNRNRDKNTVIIVINIIEVRGGKGRGSDGIQFGGDQGKNNTGIAEKEKAQKDKEQAQKDQEQKDKEQAQKDQEQKDKEQVQKDQGQKNQEGQKQNGEEQNVNQQEQQDQAQKEGAKNATEAIGGIAANGTADNVIRTVYATHTLLADNGSKETDTVQVFDYQKTDIAGNAVGAVPTSTDLAAANKDIVLPIDGAAAPSYAKSQPDPASPAAAGR